VDASRNEDATVSASKGLRDQMEPTRPSAAPECRIVRAEGQPVPRRSPCLLAFRSSRVRTPGSVSYVFCSAAKGAVRRAPGQTPAARPARTVQLCTRLIDEAQDRSSGPSGSIGAFWLRSHHVIPQRVRLAAYVPPAVQGRSIPTAWSWPAGASGASWHLALPPSSTGSLAKDISCPTLLTMAEGDPIGARAPKLFDALTVDRRELLRFTDAEGCGGHCEGMGRRLYHQRVYDWLDETLASPR
jgi:hypothetical protein